MVFDGVVSRWVYVASVRRGVFKSSDGAGSWEPTVFPAGSVTEIAIDPNVPSTLYVSSLGGAVFKSTDGAMSWMEASSGLPADYSVFDVLGTNAGQVPIDPDGMVSNFAIDPTMSNTLYVAIRPGGIFKSTDGGGSWQATALASSERDGYAVAIDPRGADTVYAGTDLGVFKSTDGGGSWRALGAGLPGAAFALAVDPSSPTTVYAGSLGGVFEIEQVCVDCDGTGAVSIADLMTMVSIAISHQPVSGCVIGDVDHSGQITVDEILIAVNLGLTGCL
jgi:photosystem II stability/assembly factor-like uncharacterized protein